MKGDRTMLTRLFPPLAGIVATLTDSRQWCCPHLKKINYWASLLPTLFQLENLSEDCWLCDLPYSLHLEVLLLDSGQCGLRCCCCRQCQSAQSWLWFWRGHCCWHAFLESATVFSFSWIPIESILKKSWVKLFLDFFVVACYLVDPPKNIGEWIVKRTCSRNKYYF